MATKKQKREAALAKREAFMKKTEASGLEALERDREWRKQKEARISMEIKNEIDRLEMISELAEETRSEH